MCSDSWSKDQDLWYHSKVVHKIVFHVCSKCEEEIREEQNFNPPVKKVKEFPATIQQSPPTFTPSLSPQTVDSSSEAGDETPKEVEVIESESPNPP